MPAADAVGMSAYKIITLCLLLSVSMLVSGCGVDDTDTSPSGSDQSSSGAEMSVDQLVEQSAQAKDLGSVDELLGCYSDEGDDPGWICWVRFTDGMVCLRSIIQSSTGGYFSYTNCKGGFADSKEAQGGEKAQSEDFSEEPSPYEQ